MIARISRGLTWFVSRYLPDPLVFAILLTVIIFIAGMFAMGTPAGLTVLQVETAPAWSDRLVKMVNLWGNGFWNLLAFGMRQKSTGVEGVNNRITWQNGGNVAIISVLNRFVFNT